MKLSRASALELRNFLGSVAAVLARHADSDPQARHLYRELSADESGEASSRTIFLAADDSDAPAFKTDLAGHVLADYADAPRHCLRCAAILIAAGDPTPEMPPGSFAKSALHEATQRYILANPGMSYLKALNRVIDVGGFEP
jgi:hypothetical protein